MNRSPSYSHVLQRRQSDGDVVGTRGALSSRRKNQLVRSNSISQVSKEDQITKRLRQWTSSRSDMHDWTASARSPETSRSSVLHLAFSGSCPRCRHFHGGVLVSLRDAINSTGIVQCSHCHHRFGLISRHRHLSRSRVPSGSISLDSFVSRSFESDAAQSSMSTKSKSHVADRTAYRSQRTVAEDHEDHENIVKARELAQFDRFALYTFRQDLKRRRQKLNDLLSQVINAQRQSWSPDMKRLYEELEAARDEYGMYEVSYDQAEESYDFKECELNSEESAVFARYADSATDSLTFDDVEDLMTPRSSARPASNIPETFSKEFLLPYRSAAKEVDHLKEALQSLRISNVQAVEPLNHRDSETVPEDSESHRLIGDFETREKVILDRLEQVEIETQRLRSQVLPGEAEREIAHDWCFVNRGGPEEEYLASRAQTERAVDHLVEKMRSTGDKFSLWLFEDPPSSAVELARETQVDPKSQFLNRHTTIDPSLP